MLKKRDGVTYFQAVVDIKNNFKGFIEGKNKVELKKIAKQQDLKLYGKAISQTIREVKYRRWENVFIVEHL